MASIRGTNSTETIYGTEDADTILARIAAFRDQGISKFVLRPIADSDDEMVEQSRRLSREVIPFVEQIG